MTFNEYQQKSRKTAIYPQLGANLVYPALGLCDEAGEFVGKLKKHLRGDDGPDGTLSDERRAAMLAELGDVLWYIAQLATELGADLDTIAQGNIDKLYSRMERDQLHGDGDQR